MMKYKILRSKSPTVLMMVILGVAVILKVTECGCLISTADIATKRI